MNYLVAVDTFFPDRPSGSARVAWDIAQLMRDRGHKVTIFCCKQNSDDEEVSEYENVKIVRFRFPDTFSLDPFKLRKQTKAGLKVAARYLATANWDVAHIHLPIQGNIIYRLLGTTVRYIYTVHSPAVLECKIKWLSSGITGRVKWILGRNQVRKLEGRLLQKADKIHTLSNFTKGSIDNFYKVGGKVTVIPHWCRKDFFRQYSKQEARRILDWPEGSKILFSVRRLAPRMGLDIAIKALAPLLKAYSNVFFALAGAGSLEKSLKQMAQSLGVDEKVWFLGRVNDETLKRCYEAADLFILPTRALECFGLPVLEAFAFGLPIISTDAAALPELIRPILPQCIVPAGSEDALKEKITAYLEDRLQFPSPETLVTFVKVRYGAEVISPLIAKLIEN